MVQARKKNWEKKWQNANIRIKTRNNWLLKKSDEAWRGKEVNIHYQSRAIYFYLYKSRAHHTSRASKKKNINRLKKKNPIEQLLLDIAKKKL
jgi:hypothetical protein